MSTVASPRRLRRAALLATVLLGAAAMPSAAQAAADVEGIWSFSGGQVVVQPQADGSFSGTVIRPTQFSVCPHPVGEVMWTQVRLQPDGQYFGKHNWLVSGSCALSGLGNSAWRVLAKPDGQKFLRICFASDKSPELQPSIDPLGNSVNTTTGCQDSDVVVPPTKKPDITNVTSLPKKSKKKCLSKRSFKIRLKEPKGDALDSAKVYVNGKLVRTIKRDRLTAPVNLTGLPKGRYKVKITAKTVLGETITGTRTYRTCTKKRKSSKKIKV